MRVSLIEYVGNDRIIRANFIYTIPGTIHREDDTSTSKIHVEIINISLA